MTIFQIDPKSVEDDVIQIQSRSMSDPTQSDIDFINKMTCLWTTQKLSEAIGIFRQYMARRSYLRYS